MTLQTPASERGSGPVLARLQVGWVASSQKLPLSGYLLILGIHYLFLNLVDTKDFCLHIEVVDWKFLFRSWKTWLRLWESQTQFFLLLWSWAEIPLEITPCLVILDGGELMGWTWILLQAIIAGKKWTFVFSVFPDSPWTSMLHTCCNQKIYKLKSWGLEYRKPLFLLRVRKFILSKQRYQAFTERWKQLECLPRFGGWQCNLLAHCWHPGTSECCWLSARNCSVQMSLEESLTLETPGRPVQGTFFCNTIFLATHCFTERSPCSVSCCYTWGKEGNIPEEHLLWVN